MITIHIEYDDKNKWFRADCKQLAGTPPIGLGTSIEHAVCALLGHPDLRSELIRKAMDND